MQTGKRYYWVDSPVMDIEDMRQCAYIGFTRALEWFNPEKGHFLTALVFGIRRICGWEYKRMCETPFGTILSLDAPIQNDDGDDSRSIGDSIPDEFAERYFESIDDDSSKQIIIAAAERLRTPAMTRVIIECVLGERTMESLAEELGVSRSSVFEHKKRALRQLRRKPPIRALLKQCCSLRLPP
jgi:RNA polymerase sigma factor (sigma-70 family)